MVYLAVFTIVLLMLSLRARQKNRRRPASGTAVMDAARLQGEYAGYEVRPHRIDPVTGGRDWGQA